MCVAKRERTRPWFSLSPVCDQNAKVMGPQLDLLKHAPVFRLPVRSRSKFRRGEKKSKNFLHILGGSYIRRKLIALSLCFFLLSLIKTGSLHILYGFYSFERWMGFGKLFDVRSRWNSRSFGSFSFCLYFAWYGLPGDQILEIWTDFRTFITDHQCSYYHQLEISGFASSLRKGEKSLPCF